VTRLSVSVVLAATIVLVIAASATSRVKIGLGAR
jgi:hypothetical protein